MSESPLHPMAYEAQYADGRRIRWDSPGGPWGEARLPVAGLRRLLALRRGMEVALDVAGPIEGVYLKMRGTLTLGRGGAHRRRWAIGVRLPDGQIDALCISDRGRVTRYRGPSAGW